MRFPDARILIFAKAPYPGAVNTRLAPLLGEASAAAFHAACVRHMVGLRARAALAPVSLHAAPDTSHPLFAELADTFALDLRPQVGADLGERMANAVAQSLGEARSVLLTGTDAVCLANQRLAQALNKLDESCAPVLIPAADGGYVLLGLGRDTCLANCDLFSDMPWGSAQVAALTRARCADAGLELCELPSSWDLDRPEDLLRLAGPGGLPADVRDWNAARWGVWLRQRVC